MLRSVAVALALALLAPNALATDRAVTIASNAYAPSPLSAEVGDVVTWTNQDGVDHTVSCDNGCPYFSGDMPHLATFTVTLEGSGTQTYTCDFHPGMHGSLFVGTTAAADADLAPVPGTLSAGRGTLVSVAGFDVPNPLVTALRVQVTNRGGAASSAASVDFVVTDGTGIPQVVATGALAPLAPGASATVTGDWSGAPLSGDATVTVVVDSANDVVESFESNNVMTEDAHVGIL